ncbi:MAG: VOC family protein [Candidatus Thorarchaeota archaeon]
MVELKLSKFDHIGILVKDIEKAAEFYDALLDFTGKINIVKQTSNVNFRGNEVQFKMKKIMQHFGGKQFEIIELLESTGDHLYSEFLKEGKIGLHHLGVFIKDSETLIKHFKNKYKIDVIQSGKVGKVRFYYLDTQEVLGYYLELITL